MMMTSKQASSNRFRSIEGGGGGEEAKFIRSCL